MEVDVKLSPMMEQWHACKAKAKDALLLFRLGDFYEAFYEDAVTLAKELELTLTKRQSIPMSGIPAQTLDGYVEKLVAKGFLVAIAEQMESPKEGKTLVKREIVQIVSPGTYALSDTTHNFFASLCQVNASIGVCFADISTGNLISLEIESLSELMDTLTKRSPKEILVSEKFSRTHASFFEELKMFLPFKLTVKEDWYFDHQIAYNFLTKHFKVHSLDGFGLNGQVSTINALGALLSHIENDLSQTITQIQSIRLETSSSYMTINHTTKRHLDLEALFTRLNRTKTPMGARLLKEWILHPLLSPDAIRERQDGVEQLTRTHLDLEGIRDLERLGTKLNTQNATPRDLLALAHSLEKLPLLQKAIAPL